MSLNLDMFWITGLIAVGVGLTVLIMIVRSDLAPVGSKSSFLDGGGRIFLGVALGIGIIAFSLKLIAVLVLSSYPEKTIDPLLEGQTNLGFGLFKEEPLAAAPLEPQPVVWKALPAIAPAPRNNPTTNAKIALGQRLFNDVNLSKDRTVACASCHDLDKYAGADGRAVAIGVGLAEGGRNTPTVLNAAYQARLFWDGRAASLEAQAVGPLMNPIEMAMPSADAVVERVKEGGRYDAAFKDAFGEDARVDISNIAKAIAAYERTLVTVDAPIDRFIAGDKDALTVQQKRGMYMFRKLGCNVCHAGPNFSGASNVGPKRPFAHLRTDRLDEAQSRLLSADKGRSPDTSTFGLWRVPSLRNVALTGPYLHNGSIETLRNVVTIMAKAQINADIVPAKNASQVGALHWDGGRARFDETPAKRITEDDILDIVAFLHALSSDTYVAKQKSADMEISVSQATEAPEGAR